MKDRLGLADPEDVRIRGWSGRIRGGGKEGHFGMEPVVCIKRADGSGIMFGVVIGKLGQREKAGPVCLLVVTIHPQVLLQHRIQPLRLAIRLESRVTPDLVIQLIVPKGGWRTLSRSSQISYTRPGGTHSVWT